MSYYPKCSKCICDLVLNEDPTLATSYWELNVCECLLCNECFAPFAMDIKKQCPNTQCRKINISITHHSYTSSSSRATRSQQGHDLELQSKVAEIDCNAEYITLTKPGSVPICIETGTDGIAIADQGYVKTAIKQIFASFHTLLVPKKKATYKNKTLASVPGATYNAKLESLVNNDTSLLNTALTSLAVGNGRQDVADTYLGFKIFAAAENIRHAICGRGSDFRTVITNQLDVIGSDDIFNLLRKIGMCYSRQNEGKNSEARTIDIKDTIGLLELDKHCYAILLFDNLGFKNRQGYRKGLGYEQYTVLKIVVIPKEQLKKIGVYADNASAELKRTPNHIWEELRKDEIAASYENILAPTNDDCNSLALVSLDIARAIMVAEKNGTFPSLHSCREMLENDVFRSQNKKPNIFHCPQYPGRQDPVVNDNNIDSDDEIEIEKVINDVPMKFDLSKKETVRLIMNYSNDIVAHILEKGKDDDEGYQRYKPIHEDVRSSLVGDGSPIIAAHNIMRSEHPLSIRAHLAVFGGFHLMLELYKKRGSMFEMTHLRNIFSMTRKSPAAQDHVLQPSDPSQAERETMQMHCGIYLSALRALIRLKRADCNVIEVLDDELKEQLNLASSDNEDNVDMPYEENSSDSDGSESYEERSSDDDSSIVSDEATTRDLRSELSDEEGSGTNNSSKKRKAMDSSFSDTTSPTKTRASNVCSRTNCSYSTINECAVPAAVNLTLALCAQLGCSNTFHHMCQTEFAHSKQLVEKAGEDGGTEKKLCHDHLADMYYLPEDSSKSQDAVSSVDSSLHEDDLELLSEIEITPAELIDFMMERCKRNPQAWVVMMDMRFTEIIFMLLRSESNADPALYCAGLRYAMILCVNTNASPTYASIVNACQTLNSKFTILSFYFAKQKTIKQYFRIGLWNGRCGISA